MFKVSKTFVNTVYVVDFGLSVQGSLDSEILDCCAISQSQDYDHAIPWESKVAKKLTNLLYWNKQHAVVTASGLEISIYFERVCVCSLQYF